MMQSNYRNLVPTNPVARAVLIGIIAELAAAGLFAVGGFGPCGPSNPIGYIGLLAHMFPSLLIVEGIDNIIKIPGIAASIAAIVIQALFWITVAYAIIRLRDTRRAIKLTPQD